MTPTLSISKQLSETTATLAFATQQYRMHRSALKELVDIVKELKMKDITQLHRSTRWRDDMPYGIALKNAEQLLRPADENLLERLKGWRPL